MLSRDKFQTLAKVRGDTLITLYLPTHPRGPEIQQDPIRLKNLLTEAEARAGALGLPASRIQSQLKPAYRLVDDSAFWRHQSEGLALFCSKDACSEYRLPMAVEELAVVGDRFCVRPLLPAVSNGRHYCVLALSQKDVRLFECTQDNVEELDLPNVPKSLEEAVGHDWEENSLQHHVGDASGRAMFHGHGAATDKSDEEIEEFLRAVDRGVTGLLADERPPLVIAAVEYLIPLYRRVSAYPRVLEQGLVGNPDRLKAEELHARARDIAAAYLDQPRLHDLHTLNEAIHTDRAVSDIVDVLTAAQRGRIGTLFVGSNGPMWGRINAEGDHVDVHAHREDGDEDLVDLAVAVTAEYGGNIYVAAPSELPGNCTVAALLRY